MAARDLTSAYLSERSKILGRGSQYSLSSGPYSLNDGPYSLSGIGLLSQQPSSNRNEQVIKPRWV